VGVRGYEGYNRALSILETKLAYIASPDITSNAQCHSLIHQAQIHPSDPLSIIYTSTSVAAEQPIAINVSSDSHDSK
jgi:hypothetical protein